MNARSCACMLGCNASVTMLLTSAAANITGHPAKKVQQWQPQLYMRPWCIKGHFEAGNRMNARSCAWKLGCNESGMTYLTSAASESKYPPKNFETCSSQDHLDRGRAETVTQKHKSSTMRGRPNAWLAAMHQARQHWLTQLQKSHAPPPSTSRKKMNKSSISLQCMSMSWNLMNERPCAFVTCCDASATTHLTRLTSNIACTTCNKVETWSCWHQPAAMSARKRHYPHNISWMTARVTAHCAAMNLARRNWLLWLQITAINGTL